MAPLGIVTVSGTKANPEISISVVAGVEPGVGGGLDSGGRLVSGTGVVGVD